MAPLMVAGTLQLTSTTRGATNLAVTSRGAEGAVHGRERFIEILHSKFSEINNVTLLSDVLLM